MQYTASHPPDSTPPATPLAAAQVQLYRNKTATTAAATMSLCAVLRDIQEGRWRLPVEAARGVFLHGTTAAYQMAKSKLPAVTFGGVFSPTRSNAHLVSHSDLVLADIDHTADPHALKARLADDPHTAFVFLSVSGHGIKAAFHVVPVPDAVTYRHAWQALAAHYELMTEAPWDPAASAVAGLCFVSHDQALYWNPDAVPFPVPAMPVPPADQTPPQACRTARQQGDSHATTAAQR